MSSSADPEMNCTAKSDNNSTAAVSSTVTMPKAIECSASTEASASGNAVPTEIERSLLHPRFVDLVDESSSVNNNKLLTLFRLLIAKGTHKLKDGNSATKNGWIEFYDDAFHNTASYPGPFAMHKVHTGNDYHLKIKDLVLKLATHFNERFNAKKAEFKEDGEPVYTDAEELGHLIITERDAAIMLHQQNADAKKAAKRNDTKKLEDMERFVGTVPTHRGVKAPSGVELDDDVNEGLGYLSAQPKSKTQRTDLNPRTSSLEADDDVEVLDGPQEDSASSRSRAPGSAPSRRRNYQADLLNDKAEARTAGAAAVRAKKNKSNHGTDKMRAYPPVHDFVDAATTMSTTMVESTNALSRILQQTLASPLRTTHRHNSTPPTTPQKKRKVEDIAAIDKMIKDLKQDKREAEAEHDADEVEKINTRIKRYKELREKQEESLFQD